MLSLTTHAHLASRAMLALAVAGYWFAETTWDPVGVGPDRARLRVGFPVSPARDRLLLRAAACCGRRRRAFEERRATPARSRASCSAVSFPSSSCSAHAYAVTGHPLVLPRMTDSHDVAAVTLWVRFGANMAYNTFMLAIWFLGPLGIILVAAGGDDRPFHAAPGIGRRDGYLLLALFHTNLGIHSFGPIHYSECAVPLTIISVHGLANLLRGARDHRFDLRSIASAFTLALVIGLGIFNVTHALALREQARIQRDIYAWIDRAVSEPGGQKVVVLAPQFAAIWFHMPSMRQIGTWVFEWAPPPSGSERRRVDPA